MKQQRQRFRNDEKIDSLSLPVFVLERERDRDRERVRERIEKVMSSR